MSQDTPVVFDSRRISTITERSDIDHHQNKSAIVKDLLEGGEDWGDGFIVQDEPVIVTRNRFGDIIRTVPISEAHLWTTPDDNLEPVEGPTRTTPSPIPLSEREKVVDVLAFRLFKYYRNLPPHPTRYNPIHDGIPDAPPGSPRNLQPLPGTQLFPATPSEVFDWLKLKVIGPRAQLVNKRQGREGYASDYALRLSR